MKKIFLCSPLRSCVNHTMESNLERARIWAREIVEKGHLPIAPHLYFTNFLDDAIPYERDMGIAFGIRLLSECDELWVFGDRITEGMIKEIEHWRKLHSHKPLVCHPEVADSIVSTHY